jgi:hypothetical protein
MDIIRPGAEELDLLHKIASKLIYNPKRNIIYGNINFDLKFHENGERIVDEYQIEIDLNHVNQGIPIVRETGGKIVEIAKKLGISPLDLHIAELDHSLCLIIPPKIKERYPNGFSLKELIFHIEEYLYYVSYFAKYGKEPWKSYGHGNKGYLELYFENKEAYSQVFKEHFHCNSRPEMRRKIKELRRQCKYE